MVVYNLVCAPLGRGTEPHRVRPCRPLEPGSRGHAARRGVAAVVRGPHSEGQRVRLEVVEG